MRVRGSTLGWMDEVCIMGARLVIHESIYDKFLAALSAKAKAIRLGDPTCMKTQMGPVITNESRSRIAGMVDTARKQGAKVHAGAAYASLPAPFDKGYYYEPTVLGVSTKMDVWRDEVFGPVVVAVPFKTEQEAIALANDSPFGLAGKFSFL